MLTCMNFMCICMLLKWKQNDPYKSFSGTIKNIAFNTCFVSFKSSTVLCLVLSMCSFIFKFSVYVFSPPPPSLIIYCALHNVCLFIFQAYVYRVYYLHV